LVEYLFTLGSSTVNTAVLRTYTPRSPVAMV
jgi:hypothetical protein